MRNRLLFTVLLALSSFGLAAPAQAQSRAVAKWHSSHPLWMLRPDIVCSSTATTCSGGGGGVSVSGNNVWTGSNTFTDSLFFIVDDGDATKKLQFQVSGVTTGNTVVPLAFRGTAAAPSVGIPDGTANEPSIQFTSDADGTGTGLYRISANILAFVTNATEVLRISGPSNVPTMNAGSAGLFGFGSSFTAVDTVIRRGGAAATTQLGTDANGAAINQTFKAHNGITGTDINGAGLTLAPGIGTGAATGKPLQINRVITNATGTSAQTYSPATFACQTKILSNTSATVQTVLTITTATATGGSATIDYTVLARDGTLTDVDGGLVKVSWGNNAGTVTSTITAVAVQSDADASGTLAATPTRTDATNVVSFKLTPTWVTIVPTSVIGILTVTFASANAGDTYTCN